MKRTLSLLLALIMCLSLFGCGTDETSPSDNAPTSPVTTETVAGTYKSILWFIDETITLNSNTTYSCDSDDEKGTFSVTADGMIKFDPTTVTSIRQFQYANDIISNTNYWYFDKDEEFGLKFSPNENGRTEQTFEAMIINGELPGATFNMQIVNQVWLRLKNDGSFELKLGQYNSYYKTIDNLATYTGTYAYADSTLTLNYQGQSYPLPVNKSGYILFNSFTKV